MSFNLPPINAAATAPPAGPATASSSEAPTGAGSFEEALSRARQPDTREAAPKPGKAAAGTPAQQAGDAPEADTEEALEPVLVPGLAWMALEGRSTPPIFQGGAQTTAMGGGRQESAVADTLAPSRAGAALAVDEAIGLPDADAAAEVPAAPAATLALAAAAPKQRGQASAPTDLKTPPLDSAPVDGPEAAAAPLPLSARDIAVSDPPLARGVESPVPGGFAGGTGAQAGTALPPAIQEAARQAASAAPTAEEAVGFTPVDSPALLVSSAEPGAVPVPAMAASTAHAPAGINSGLPPLPVTAPSLPQDVGSSEWGQALGQQVLQMGKAGQEVAELQLHPPALGPLKVTLSMNEHQLQAAFVSAHASVRAAVEAALPQLRAALADSGISLGNTSVGTESRQPADTDQGQGARPGQRNHPGASIGRDLAAHSERPVVPARSQGHGASVDIYA